MSVKENLKIINEKIAASCAKAGRSTDSVKLMAVSKFHPVENIIEAVQAGQFLFGENRVQEACEKFPEIYKINSDVKLHMIGSLQSNKVKNAVGIASCIQSVDRIELVELIEKNCSKFNKNMEILFEVHTGEESKSGFETKGQIIQVLDNFREGKYPHVIPCGFMTMAPFTDNKELVRKSFVTLREMAESLKSEYKEYNLSELSMGMSGDFEIAIEEGSTLVRIGTAIFGERNY